MASPATARFLTVARGAKKILVVDLGFLGDTLHLIPALWELRRNFPAAKLHVVTSPLGREVLDLVTCVDRVWETDLDSRTRTARGQWELLRNVRRENFDAGISFSGSDRNVITLGSSGARVRVAYDQGRRHFWDRWLIDEWVPMRSRELPVLEQRRQVLAALGVPLSAPQFDLQIAPADTAWAAGRVKTGTVHLSLNSATPLNEWPVAHFAALGQRLAREFPGLPLAVSAMAKEREQARVREFLAAVSGVPVNVLPVGMSIGQLAAVIQRCRLHFGPDSGVMHLAMALGVPTVSLFREKGNFREWFPTLSGHDGLLAPCQCVIYRDAPCAASGQARCLAGITVDLVAERIAGRLRK